MSHHTYFHGLPLLCNAKPVQSVLEKLLVTLVTIKSNITYITLVTFYSTEVTSDQVYITSI